MGMKKLCVKENGKVKCNTFSILAGKEKSYKKHCGSCRWASELCTKECYKNNGSGNTKFVKRCHAINYTITMSELFIDLMTEEIEYYKYEDLRIHSYGEFYENEYIEKWIEIINKCKDTRFYAYTRAWSDDLIDNSLLLSLSKLHNMVLYQSFDHTMDSTKLIRKLPIATMGYDEKDKELPDWMRQRKIVYCPATKNRLEGLREIHCNQPCKICMIGKSDVYIPIHKGINIYKNGILRRAKGFA